MKVDVFVWNCQGAGNPKFHRILKEYLRDFEPDVVVLVKIRISGLRADSVIKGIKMPHSHRVEAQGFSGGIWLLWETDVIVDVESNNFQFVQLKVKFLELQDWVLFSGIYGSLSGTIRREL